MMAALTIKKTSKVEPKPGGFVFSAREGAMRFSLFRLDTTDRAAPASRFHEQGRGQIGMIPGGWMGSSIHRDG
jgi:hypothetical protein